jgi:hypothetical protein
MRPAPIKLPTMQWVPEIGYPIIEERIVNPNADI